MQTTEVDGVAVFWAPAPGPLTAGLVFGCGTRDETFQTIGVTHLVEHLVMSTLPKVHHEHNAQVDLTTTQFFATGRPEQIVAFLRGVCEGIARLPLERLHHEAGVLEAEGGFAVHPTAAPLLTRRYGIRDVGLENFAGPGPAAIGPEALAAHVRRFFVAANAALWLSGEPPADLHLSLPAGPRPQRTEPVPLPQGGPTWESLNVPATGMLLRGDPSAAFRMASTILAERLEDEARHRRGLSYEVFGDRVMIGPATREHLIGANARTGEAASVARILWEQATALATQGPSPAELEHQQTGVAELYADERWPVQEATDAAEASVLGVALVDPTTRLAQVRALTVEDVRAAMAAALPTALIAVPGDVEALDLPGVAPGSCPSRRAKAGGKPYTMLFVARLFSWQWSVPRFFLTADGMARLDADGALHETPFADIVAVQADKDMRVVFAANGCVHAIPIPAYRDGDHLAYVIDSAIDPRLRCGSDNQPPAPMVVPRAGRWTASRVLNALGAVLFGLCTVVLALATVYLDYSNWGWAGGLALTVWCAVDARPRGRALPVRRRTPS